MKKHLSVLSISFTLIFVSFSFAQEPFAPKLDFQKYHIFDPSFKTLFSNLAIVEVPDIEVVGVPAYPQAKIIQINDGSKDCFNCIRLLTADDCKKIVTFYKKNLKNWLNGDFKDCYQFWQGPRWDAMQGKAPNITILPVNEKYKNCFHLWYKRRRYNLW